MPDVVLPHKFARAAAPADFLEHAFERDWLIDRPRHRVWRWINDPRTFSEAQIWPYRVEMIDDGTGRDPTRMTPGQLNTHHGPLVSFTGVVGEMLSPADAGNDRPAYRDLQYLYGSYAFSLRLVRPTRLQFWLDRETPGITRIRMRLDSLVHPKAFDWWTRGQAIFWTHFPKKAIREIA